MNNKTRKVLKGLIDTIELLQSVITDTLEDEQEKFDNMPEGLQQSDNGMQMEAAVAALEEAIVSFDDAIGNIEEAIG